MSVRTEKFLTILILELKDLIDDLKTVLESIENRHINEEISNYIYSENKAFRSNELEGLTHYITTLETLDPRSFRSRKELVDYLYEEINKAIRQQGYPAALRLLVKKKIQKVDSFMKEAAVF